ncbi:MAG: EAL domain-containing response regulator [Thermoanaerobaculia bacterium]
MNPADRSVLVVDDDAQLCRLVAEVARRCGFDARIALSAREAWLALDPEPALVLLDLNMPDADGLEVLRELASRQCAAQIRVFSGTDPKILRSAAQLGRNLGLAMGEPLSKPVSVAALREMFGEVARATTVGLPKPAAVPAGAPAPPPITADELRQGIRRGELFVAFQPILELATLSPVGAEALVRWRHPVYGVVPPVHFVALAESSGLAAEMTERIFALALEFAGRPEYSWAGKSLAISVNVAAAALIELDLAALLAALLPAYGVSPNRLVVEVTETVMSADRARVLEVLSRLRLRGIELSIDDFGTGTSSLERLDQFPFTELKIERAFIADLLRRPDAEAIAVSTIELARRLDLRVVAEGIEDVRTLQWLRGSGCSTGQGFLFARGLEENDFLRWLVDWNERRSAVFDASAP